MKNNKRLIKLFMQKAIKEAYKGIQKKHGGPFGAVVVKNNKVIAKGHNKVLKNNDPTAHGEIVAIRKACKKLKTFDLSDCILITTGECCTMCLCAAMWANIKHIYYGASLKDNEMIGFRDDKFDKLLGGREKLSATNFCTQICRDDVIKLFNDYLLTNPINY